MSAIPDIAGVQPDAFHTRIVVMVDEATEPSLTDAEAGRRRAELVALANSSTGGPGAAGANITFALRKRLKSDDAAAVMNTLRLLDELMRSCPYFYRHVADDKMFRRLWRFVVPDYKSGMRAVFSRGKTAADLRATAGRPEIAVKVLILIRAWAEELSEMYDGRYDPAAGFLIERYNSKRQRLKFPDVPRSELPWVCPVGNSVSNVYAARASSAAGSSSSALPESLGLGEVENTVNLFENILENAQHVKELKSDVCKELVGRCRLIAENLDKLSMSMDKEEELARAVKVSEKLRRALDAYDVSIRTGEVNKPIPVASKISNSEESDQESYTPGAGSSTDFHSAREDESHLTQHPDRPLPARRRTQIPRAATTNIGRRKAGIDRSRSHDSHLDALNIDNGIELTPIERRERREEAQRRFHREYVASKRGSSSNARQRAVSVDSDRERQRERQREREAADEADRERERQHEREKERELERQRERDREREREKPRSKRREERERERGSSDDREEERRAEVEARRKAKKRELKKANSMYVGSASGAKPPRKARSKDGKRKYTRSASLASAPKNKKLVDVDDSPPVGADTDSSERDTFARLGERFDKGDNESNTDSEMANSVQSINITPNAAALYQTNPYSSMMMMPPMPMPMPPMGMYGSVNPMMANNALFNAYNTINPAMYYSSVNPMAAYATANPQAFAALNAQLTNPFMQQQPPQQPQPQPPMSQAGISQPQMPQAPLPQAPLQPPMPQASLPQASLQPPMARPFNPAPQGSPPPAAQPGAPAEPEAPAQPLPPQQQLVPSGSPPPQVPAAPPIGGMPPPPQMGAMPPPPPMGGIPPPAPPMGGMPPPPGMPPMGMGMGMPPMMFPGMPPPPPFAPDTGAGVPQPPNSPPPPVAAQAQAAAFQHMANAAAAYQAAAAAYQSVSAQPPLVPQQAPAAAPDVGAHAPAPAPPSAPQ